MGQGVFPQIIESRQRAKQGGKPQTAIYLKPIKKSNNSPATENIAPPSGGWGAFLSLASQIAQKQPEAIALLSRVYQQLFNQTIQQGCGNCYQKAFFRIQKYLYLQQQNQLLNDPISMTTINRKYLL